MCRVISCVVGRVCFLWSVRSLGKSLLAFALLHSVLQGQICLLFQVSLDFPLLHSNPLWWKGHLFLVLVLEGLVGLHRTIQLQLLQYYSWGIDLEYCDIEWFALETNRDHSVFETAPKYCISDSLVDYEGYSISSKGFLPAVVDILASELNSPIPVHFCSLIPKMSMFTLAISCLIIYNLPWFMDLTFQVPMQYCSLQHWTLLSSPVISTFFLELFLHSSPVAYWAPTKEWC